jgi:hypothetical protein
MGNYDIFHYSTGSREAFMGRYAVLALFMLFVSVSAVQADFYRWVDSDGKEYYTNDPAKVPPEYRDRSKPVEVRDDRVSVGEKPSKPSGRATSTAAVKGHKDKYGHGEEWWRKRASNMRLQLRDLQDEYDLLLKQEQERQEKEKNHLNGKKKSTASFEKKKATLEKKLAKARRMLDVELPEDARKADAYPGWIRE